MKQIEIKGDKVDPQEVEDAIAETTYVKLGKKIVVCHITLEDGFEVIGKAGVVNPDLFNQEMGEKVALQNAMNRVWEHMGSILQDRLCQQK